MLLLMDVKIKKSTLTTIESAHSIRYPEDEYPHS